MLRFDHVGVVVDDLDTAVAFFLDLGFERAGGSVVEGEAVDKVNGLDGVRAEFVMLRAPGGGGSLEIVKYHAPAAADGAGFLPANRAGFRHICVEIQGLDATVARLRDEGFDLVGEAADFGNTFRLCYVNGPEGLIVELAERITAERASAESG